MALNSIRSGPKSSHVSPGGPPQHTASCQRRFTWDEGRGRKGIFHKSFYKLPQNPEIFCLTMHPACFIHTFWQTGRAGLRKHARFGVHRSAWPSSLPFTNLVKFSKSWPLRVSESYLPTHSTSKSVR